MPAQFSFDTRFIYHVILDLKAYDLQPLDDTFGAEIKGILLKDVTENENIVEQIKSDLWKHRILIFRNQVRKKSLKARSHQIKIATNWLQTGF